MSEVALKHALCKLEEAVGYENGGAVEKIDSAVSNVAKLKDPSSIGPLLCMLNDNALFDEGMYSLIHAAEEFNDDVYTRELLSVLSVMRHKAPAWASVVLMRALNNDQTHNCLTRKARTVSRETKESLVWLLEQINKESPAFLAKTVALLVAART